MIIVNPSNNVWASFLPALLLQLVRSSLRTNHQHSSNLLRQILLSIS